MGIKLTLQLAIGLIKAIPQLVSMLPRIISAIVSGFKSGVGSMISVGKNLVVGLWNGIRNSTQWITDKVKSFAKGILNGIKSALGVHSPSTKTHWMGQMLDKGLAGGIIDNANEPLNAMDRLSADLLNSAGQINGATIERQLNTTFNGNISAESSRLDALVNKMDEYMPKVIEAAKKAIMLDSGVLVGETVDQFDVALSNKYGLKARGA